MTKGTVYLLHFAVDLEGIRHEVGFTTRHPVIRLGEHLAGHGSRLTQDVRKAGIDIYLARTFRGTMETERLLQHYEHLSELCPFCQKERERHAIREG